MSGRRPSTRQPYTVTPNILTAMDTTKTELNLFDLIVLFFRWIGRLCAGLWKLCGRALQLTYRQWWIVCLLVALGIGAALYLSRPSRRYYKAEATAIINGPTSMTIGQALKPVMQTTSAKLSEAHTLSSVLGLSDSVAAHVRQIDWFPIVDCLNDGTPDYIDYKRKAKMNDTTNVISDKYVQLRVMTYRPAEIPIIEKALLDYLNNLPSLQESYELYQHAAGGIYESVTHQVAYLDSLGRRLYVEEPIERKLDIEKGHIMVGDGGTHRSEEHTSELQSHHATHARHTQSGEHDGSRRVAHPLQRRRSRREQSVEMSRDRYLARLPVWTAVRHTV